jgi:hypothetical protein
VIVAAVIAGGLDAHQFSREVLLHERIGAVRGRAGENFDGGIIK